MTNLAHAAYAACKSASHALLVEIGPDGPRVVDTRPHSPLVEHEGSALLRGARIDDVLCAVGEEEGVVVWLDDDSATIGVFEAQWVCFSKHTLSELGLALARIELLRGEALRA